MSIALQIIGHDECPSIENRSADPATLAIPSETLVGSVRVENCIILIILHGDCKLFELAFNDSISVKNYIPNRRPRIINAQIAAIFARAGNGFQPERTQEAGCGYRLL